MALSAFALCQAEALMEHRNTICPPCLPDGIGCRPEYELSAQSRASGDGFGNPVPRYRAVSGIPECNRPSTTVACHEIRKATSLCTARTAAVARVSAALLPPEYSEDRAS
jgi:hypothetical protein